MRIFIYANHPSYYTLFCVSCARLYTGCNSLLQINLSKRISNGKNVIGAVRHTVNSPPASSHGGGDRYL